MTSQLCQYTSGESVFRTLAAAVMKSPTNMEKPGRPRKKNRGEQDRIMVLRMSCRSKSHTHTFYTHTYIQ